MRDRRDYESTTFERHNDVRNAVKGSNLRRQTSHSSKSILPKQLRKILSILSISAIAGVVTVGCQAHAEKTSINMDKVNNYIEKVSKDHPILKDELSKYQITIDDYKQKVTKSEHIEDYPEIQAKIETELKGVIVKAVENYDFENSLKDTLAGEKPVSKSELEQQIDNALKGETDYLKRSINPEKADGKKYLTLDESSFFSEINLKK